MDWEEQKEHTSARAMRELAAFRQQNPWLSQARWHALELEPQKLVLRVSDGKEQLQVEISSNQDNWQVTFN